MALRNSGGTQNIQSQRATIQEPSARFDDKEKDS